MKIVRITTIRPRPGYAQEAAGVLDELDAYLAAQAGFIESYKFQDAAEPEILGRVALWESREAADRAANTVRTIALRARLHSFGEPLCEERLLGVVSERHTGPRNAVAA